MYEIRKRLYVLSAANAKPIKLFTNICLDFTRKSLVILIAAFPAAISAQDPGKMVPVVKLSDVNDVRKSLPFQGNKVFVLFYIDPDRQHIIDPLTNALDSPEADKDDFEVVSVIDCADTWIPFIALKTGAKREQRLYPDSPILLDRDHILPLAWDFGNCDNSCVVAIVGKDSRIKFVQKLRSQDECKKIVETAMKALKKETG